MELGVARRPHWQERLCRGGRSERGRASPLVRAEGPVSCACLEDLVALLLAPREALVDVSRQVAHIHVQLLELQRVSDCDE